MEKNEITIAEVNSSVLLRELKIVFVIYQAIYHESETFSSYHSIHTLLYFYACCSNINVYRI